jgi:hypothetical protein
VHIVGLLVLGWMGVGTSIAGTPFGGDDAGFLPTSKGILACESKAQVLGAKLVVALAGCHLRLASAALSGSGSVASEDGCENAAVGNFLGKSSKLIAKGSCPLCVVENINHEPYPLDVAAAVDAANGTVYCAGTTPLGDDDAGFVPPDATTLKCEAAVGKELAKLQLCIAKCHAKYARAALSGLPFDEDACEDTTPMKSCRAKFDAYVARLASICPPCLDTTARDGLADQLETAVDGTNDTFYCASPIGAFLD